MRNICSMQDTITRSDNIFSHCLFDQPLEKLFEIVPFVSNIIFLYQKRNLLSPKVISLC